MASKGALLWFRVIQYLFVLAAFGVAILLEYEADKLNGQTITYVDDGEDISEVFGPVYTWVHYGVFVTGFAFLTLPILVRVRSKIHPLIPRSTPAFDNELTSLVAIEFKNWAFFLAEFASAFGGFITDPWCSATGNTYLTLCLLPRISLGLYAFVWFLFCVSFVAEIIIFVKGGPDTWERAKRDHVPNLASIETKASNWAGLGANGWSNQFQTGIQQTQGVPPNGLRQTV